MNRQIIKLFGFLLILYALLFGFTSYWSVFDSDSLKANTAAGSAIATMAQLSMQGKLGFSANSRENVCEPLRSYWRWLSCWAS